ncbi:MAG: hypothetical protein ACE366_04670, partial [Bradymonadia bacterium]
NHAPSFPHSLPVWNPKSSLSTAGGYSTHQLNGYADDLEQLAPRLRAAAHFEHPLHANKGMRELEMKGEARGRAEELPKCIQCLLELKFTDQFVSMTQYRDIQTPSVVSALVKKIVEAERAEDVFGHIDSE